MIHASLHLPPRRVTGYAGGVYTQSNVSPKGFLPRSTTKNFLPIAWTPYLQSLAAGQTEAAWIGSHVFVNPPNWYGVKNFCVRQPKIVLIDITAFPGISMGNVLGPITGPLTDNKIMVALISTASMHSYDSVFRMFLPHEGTQGVSHLVAGLGSFSATFPRVTAANWKAGQVLYLDSQNISLQVVFGQNTIFAPGSISVPDLGVFSELAEWNAFEVGQIGQGLSRYEKFGYHLVFAMKSFTTVPTWVTGGFRAAQQNIVPYVVNQIGAGNGATMDFFNEEFNPLNQAAIETAFRNKIKSFFSI